MVSTSKPTKTLILMYDKFRYHKVYMVFLKDFMNKFSNFWTMCWFVRLFHDDTRSLVVNAALTLMLSKKKNKKKHVQKTLSPFKTLGLNERFFSNYSTYKPNPCPSFWKFVSISTASELFRILARIPIIKAADSAY